MRGKEKDKKPRLTDYLKYRGNNLGGNEKNSFERELQKDPFAAEADEGFSSVDPALLPGDMEDLEKRLNSSTGNERRFVWYRIAASVAVLMVITTVFFIVRKEKPAEIASAIQDKEVTLEIQIPEVVKENAPAPAIAFNQDMRTKEKSPAGEDKKLNAAGADKLRTEDIILTDTAEREAVEMISVIAVEEKAETFPRDLKKPAAARSAVKSQDVRIVSGKVISSEDNLPIPGVNIVLRGSTLATTTDTGGNFTLSFPEKANPSLVASFIGMKSKEFNTSGDSLVSVIMDPDITALDEVVVTGYGLKRANAVAGVAVSKQVSEEEYPSVSFIAAEPVTGKEAFNKYIEDNIVRPEQQGGQKAVVVLNFTVKLNGQPANIKVVRSPGKHFSDEASRLIIEGPKWRPASENGVNIEDEVRVRIVFK
jgi:TonB family protein